MSIRFLICPCVEKVARNKSRLNSVTCAGNTCAVCFHLMLGRLIRPYSRTLLEPKDALQYILPKGVSDNPDRMGMKYFRQNSKSSKILKWHEPTIRDFLKPYGYKYETEEEIYARDKLAYLKSKGKIPTRKHMGKKKNRRK